MKAFLMAKWHWVLVFGVFVFEFLILAYFNENSYIGIHDNLDIHIVDYQILKNNHAFFAHGTTLPFLGGISRDFLASEFSLYTLLYVLLPNFYAYFAGYFLKIAIAFGSVLLLGRDIVRERYQNYEPLVVLCGLIYGLLPLYPGFSISFASIPFLVYLIRRIERKPSVKWYLLLFLYPFVSYFTFFGLFIIGYLLLYAMYTSLRLKKFHLPLFGGALLLFLGYAVFEYRLFHMMLFAGQETIRETMKMGNDGMGTILFRIGDVFAKGVFHAYDFHQYLVLPLCLTYFIFLNGSYLKRRQGKEIVKDCFNRVLALILCNSVIYGFYTFEPFRTMVETLLPPLKGFQFTRTVFFNPFLWYGAFFIVLKRLYDKAYKKTAYFLVVAGLLIVIGTQSLYNDFYNTVYTHTWMAVKGKKSESLSYREFYSSDLFERIKKEIGYDGAYSAAYGMHPAVLQYHGIATLDGVLSYYSQSYKEEFRRLIAPALEESETARIYFDHWGARAYLYSGGEHWIWSPVRTIDTSDPRLLIDGDSFRRMGGKYLFSRIRLENAEESGFVLLGEYTDDSSPYTIYAYETAGSR